MGIVGIALVIGTALGSVAFPLTKTQTTTVLTSKTNTEIDTLTQSSSFSTETADACNSQITVNSTLFCSLNVTNITSVGVPGWATMNRSVYFMGVLFQTVCQGNIGNCGNITETLSAGIVEYNVAFSDGTNENVSTAFGECYTAYFLSRHHNPTAGFYMKCVGQATSPEIFLLVETPNSTLTFSNVIIHGVVVSNFYRPLNVDFYYAPCVTSFPIQPPIVCGKTLSANLSQVTSRHILGGIAYSANYSITVPDNENYIVEVSLFTQNNTVYTECTTSCIFDAAFLPLNSTTSFINYYNIQCNSNSVGNQSANSAQISCYTHYGDFY